MMRLGGPTAKPQITKKQLPMAFAVMEALKDTRAMIEQLFDKYDMNHDREIQQSELGGLLTCPYYVLVLQKGPVSA